MASDIFAKIGDIKGESLDAKHKDEVEVLSWSWGVQQSGIDGPRRRRRRGQGELQRLQLHASHRQGVAGAVESVRDRRAHQGSDDHGAQGRQGPAGVPDHQDERRHHHQRRPERRRRSAATAESVALQCAKVDLEYKPQKADGSLDAGSISSTTSRATRKARPAVADAVSPRVSATAVAPSRTTNADERTADERDCSERRRRRHVPDGQRRQARPDQRGIAGRSAQRRDRGPELVVGDAGQGRRSAAAPPPGKATINDLRIVKRVDSASTALMLALRTNEPIQKAVLTLRKAGKSQLEYLKITIEQGRVTSLTIDGGDAERQPGRLSNE